MAATTTLSKPFSSSSSSSSYQPPDDYEYDVFLSFRDEDTRKNFTDHLYHALKEAGIHTFRDDDVIRKGEDLSSEILQAIRGSRISFVVLSKNYASSRWCLEELVEIMECRRRLKQKVIPIFYHVDPSDVRKLSGTFEKAFVEHEKRYLLDKDKVLRWRGALTEAANTAGFHLGENTVNGNEAEPIRNIILYISPIKIFSKAFSSSSSSSSSSYQPPDDYEYDVFLSFRGDTRKKFTDHLYYALTEAGIHTFRDNDEIQKGEDLSSEILQAIRGSRISVIVFSKNYASSRWCLDELVEILECRRRLKQIVVPIFYEVVPHDVRWQRGSYEQAFVEHEKLYFFDKDKVFRWRGALTEAANLSGWYLEGTADGHEAKIIREIIHAISSQLDNKYLFVARYPVGVEARMKDMTSLLCVGDNDVRMVGILGMGGTGKTTIAKAVYNQFYHHFEGRSFLQNVRETSKQHGLVYLQKQLLSKTLTSKIEVSSVDSGIVMIRRLRHKRVLIIVDDVDQLEQLNAIAGSCDWFGLGSRIIITTRDDQLLKNFKVDGVYTAKQMGYSESLELFSWHAFRNNYPTKDYMDISKSVVAYSGGLPLALEVLGSFLLERRMEEWKSALEKLKRIPHDKVQEKLRISFDALSDDTEKDTFLDISCFFIGMDKNYVVQILDGCGFFAKIGISVLIQRCLLTVDERNKLMMHDLLRDMGREIIRENYPKEPGKRSRLWLQEEVTDILTLQKGMEGVEGLALKLPRSEVNFNTKRSEVNFNTKTFIKMQRLRLLQLDFAQPTGDYEYLSKELRWLRWHGFPLKFIPNNFYPGKIVAIDLRYSNLRKVWKHPKLLNKLEVLNLSHSHDLTRTPDFSKLPNLKKLILKDCTSLFEVHQSIGDLHKLVLVNLKGCKNLRSMPSSLYKLKSLETLILSDCSNIDNLANDLGEMECLTTLRIDNTSIRQVPFTIGRLKNLKHLSLRGCKGSQPKSWSSYFWSLISPSKIPKSVNILLDSVQGLSSLKELCLSDCDLLDDTIPKGLGSLYALQSLDLQSNRFHALPSSLSGLSRLRRLNLDYCRELQSIPNLPTSLNSLHARNCTALERMPNVSKISGMGALFLTNCHKLVEIPGLDKMLKYFGILHMEGCNNMTSSFKQSILQECIMSGVGNMFSIYLPGDDIPDCFMYKNERPIVCFEVPIIGLNVVGFVVCTVYSPCASNNNIVCQNLLSISVVNHTKNISQTSRQITADVVISLEDHLWLGNVSKGEFNLEGGDKVDIIIDFGVGFIVKKIGVSLLYDGVLDGKMIPYASTSNEDVKAQAWPIKFERGLHDEGGGPSHGWNEYRPQPKRLKKMINYAFTSNEDVKDQDWSIKFKRGLHDEEAGLSHCWLEDEPNP